MAFASSSVLGAASERLLFASPSRMTVQVVGKPDVSSPAMVWDAHIADGNGLSGGTYVDHGPTPPIRSTVMCITRPGGGSAMGGKVTSGPR